MAMRDVYDVVGMLDAGDPHRDAIELYNKIDHGTDCRYTSHRLHLRVSEGLHFKKSIKKCRQGSFLRIPSD